MSGRIKFWIFVLLIPVFAAIGHDLYTNYYSTDDKRTKLEALQVDPSAYQVSDFGYMMVTYTPDFYESARTAVGEQKWTKWVDPVLRQYTFVVLFIPSLIFYLYLILARLFHFPPYSYVAPTDERKTDFLERRNRDVSFKYKRRR